MIATAGPQLDAISFSITQNRLNSILQEMTVAMSRTAFSALLSLTHDFSCCVYDADGRQVAMVDALPIHTNSMHLFLKAIVSSFGEDIAAGDVFMANDPYAGNTHIGDLAMAAPVFLGEEHLLWVAIRAHQLDVGAPVPHSSFSAAENVWQEGLTIPPVRLHERGVVRKDVMRFYLDNLRWRDLLEGDLMAQVGAINLGVRRLEEVCALHGSSYVRQFIEEAIAYGSRRTAEEIRAMEPGVYRGCAWYDDPAPGVSDVPIECEVRISGDSVEVEFVNVRDQVNRGVNATEAVLLAGGGIPLLMLLDPDVPHNHGCLERIRVDARKGSICNASYPASTSLATILPGDVMQESVARAVAAASPERSLAGNARWGLIPMLSGRDPRTGKHWGHQLLNPGGGGGAVNGCDGWPLMTTSAARGGLRTASVEHTELLHPIVIDEWEIAEGSMGLGEFIGGPGVRFSWRTLGAPVEVVYDSDGLRNPPFGLFGATAGAGGGAWLEDIDGGSQEALPPCVHMIVPPTKRWVGVATGGGGWGSPLNRAATQVMRDVRNGYYSKLEALTVFGVALNEDLSLDEAATDALRADMRRTQSDDDQFVQPDAPGAARWVSPAGEEAST